MTLSIMRKHSLCLFLLMLFASTRLFASEDGVIKLEYEGLGMRGDTRWRADTEIRSKGGDVYVMVEKVNGIYSGFDGPVSWVAELEFESTEDTVRPVSLDKKVFDENGDVIRIEEQRFDLNNNTAVCTHRDIPRNISRTKRFKFDKDVVNRLLLGLYVQKFLEKGKTLGAVQMVSEEPGVYTLDLSVINKETILVNSRKVKAYKLSIDPRLGLLNVVKVFFPRTYAWHSAEPGFEWLKYSGLEGDVRSEKVDIIKSN
jgi:hypothetical protein